MFVRLQTILSLPEHGAGVVGPRIGEVYIQRYHSRLSDDLKDDPSTRGKKLDGVLQSMEHVETMRDGKVPTYRWVGSPPLEVEEAMPPPVEAHSKLPERELHSRLRELVVASGAGGLQGVAIRSAYVV